MAELKLSDLISEIEKHAKEGSASGAKIAVLEAHKVLEAVLTSKGYPGKTIEKKLYWAGFSLKGKDDFLAALKKQKEISHKIEVSISDFEAKEVIDSYLRVIKVIAERDRLNVLDQLKSFFDMYFSPQSLVFWRNLAIFFGSFSLVRFLSGTNLGEELVLGLVGWSEIIISWQFFVIVAVLMTIVYLVQNYFSGKTKVRIKEEPSPDKK